MTPLRRIAVIGNSLPRRCGIATFNVSCDQQSLPAPAARANVQRAAINFALVIMFLPSSRPATAAATVTI